uniref:Protein kinase domain-containing protein n=1 Tax=Anopheles gambiae TaxID=7165 RepID=A0A1S4GYM0_ANOGA
MNFLQLLCPGEGLENPKFNLSFIPCETQRWNECRTSNVKLRLEIAGESDIERDDEKKQWLNTILKVPGILVCDVLSDQGNRSTAISLQHLEYSDYQRKTLAMMLITVVGIICLVLMIVICVAHAYKRSWEGKNIPSGSSADGGLKTSDITAKVHHFPREKVQLVERLRQGEYGVYWKAIVTGVADDPALEFQVMVKEAAKRFDTQDLLEELKTYVQVGHHVNVLNFLGIVTENMVHGEFFVITEYCRFGNLKDFLLKHRHAYREEGDDEIAENIGRVRLRPQRYTFGKMDLLYWSYQIACGLQYLASRGFVYGNLSTRHVLLGEGNIVKLSGFGSPYRLQLFSKLTPQSILSLERIAPECLQSDGTFTSSSDVWSYGVLLWELFSLGCDPCWGLIPHGQFADSFECVSTLPTPKYANDEVYQIMRHCWKQAPQERPSFVELCSRLNCLIPRNMLKSYEELKLLYSCINAVHKSVL